MVGAGFAGLTAVRALRKVPVEVILVDRHRGHTVAPLSDRPVRLLLGASARTRNVALK